MRNGEREGSAYELGSSESTSELCFSLLPLPGSPLSAAACGSPQQGPLSVNPERNPRICSALKYTCVNIPKYQMMGISVCEWLIPCIDGGYNDSHCLCPAHPSALVSPVLVYFLTFPLKFPPLNAPCRVFLLCHS